MGPWGRVGMQTDHVDWENVGREKKDFRGCEAGGRSNQGQICLITVLLLRFEFQRARGPQVWLHV